MASWEFMATYLYLPPHLQPVIIHGHIPGKKLAINEEVHCINGNTIGIYITSGP